MKTKYNGFIGLDRSDAKCDISLRNPKGDILFRKEVPSRAKDWQALLHETRRHIPRGKIALCVEQPAANVIAFFSRCEFLAVYAINPSTLKSFRNTFVTSGAKDDDTDADWLSELLRVHYEKLTCWHPDDPLTRQIQTLTEDRRHFVNQRTSYNNRYKEIIKTYYPEALELIGETVYSRLAIDFIRKWPTLQKLQAASDETILAFYKSHSCVRRTALERRLALIRSAIPITDDAAMIQPAVMKIKHFINQLELINEAIENYEFELSRLMNKHPDNQIFVSLPGAGPVFAARLLAAIGSQRQRWENALALSNFCGISPVLRRSGKSHFVCRRYACPTFLKQSFHEWAAQTIRHSRWARAYYMQMKQKGNKHHGAIRALAYKWIRIIFKCWKDGMMYSDSRYMQSLQKNNHALWQKALSVEMPKCAKI